jgi:Zn-dependent peptidase ImmA (M78 family)
MNHTIIEIKARHVLKLLYENRKRLWPTQSPTELHMLDPAIAIQALGMNFEISEELGRFGDSKSRYEVAGMIDRQRNLVSVSRRFPLPVRRFTTAHELGHVVLHSDHIEPLHRDRPIKDFVQLGRSILEIEADYFAACFLVPRKLLQKAFQNRFGDNLPLVIDDRVAHFLDHTDPASILQGNSEHMARYTALATSRAFNGKYFDPLHKVFNVSVSAMAIRIKEVGLVREP